MNRIYTLVIASILIISGSNIFAQQLPRSPRPVQQTEVIQYATERASEVPSYRGYRKSSIYVAPKAARTFVQRTHPKDERQSSFARSPFSPRQTIEAAPVIYSSSRRVTRSAVPKPTTEISVFSPNLIEPAKTQIDVVRTKTPTKDSPNFEARSPSNFDPGDLQQSKSQYLPKLVYINEATTLSLPVEQPKTTEAAPVIPTSSRRITKTTAPRPATMIAISAPDPIESAETKIDVVRTETPAKASPNFEYRSPSDYDPEDLQQSQWQPQPKQVQSQEAIAISSPVDQLKTTEAAPVIPRSSRRITKTTVPTPTTEIAVSAPDPIEPAETQIDVVRTTTPAKASPNFKHRSPSDYSPEELQQSQWEPRPKQIQSEEAIAVSSPVKQPWTIDLTDPFETVTPAVSTDNKAAAVPLKPALLGSEESPFTSFIAETDRRPAVETGYSAEAVEPIDFATTGLTTKAELQTAKKVHTSGGKETSHQKTADVAWWGGLALLAVPFLALLGWSMFGRERYDQFEEAPTIDIPLQNNTPWQFQESTDAQLSCSVESETDPQEIHCSGEESVAIESETELLDEIHSINAIAFDSSSAARSTSNSQAKSEKN